MALIKCPECGEMVSDRAIACIKCGYPIRELGTMKDNVDAKQEQQTVKSISVKEIKKSEESQKIPDEQKLSKDKLLEYLKHAIRLESNSLGEQTIIDDYISVSDKKKPQLITEPEPLYPSMKNVPTLTSYEYCMLALGLFLLPVGIIMLILGISTNMNDAVYILAMIGMACFGAICIWYFLSSRKGKKDAEDYNASSQRDYMNKCRENEEKNRQHAKEYDKNMQTWRINVDNNLEYLHEKRGETLKVLSDYYKPDIIFPKYHSLPALTTIYEYLSSGRCDTLTGPNGAYNLYESELRQNTIIEKLNTIIADLEQIKKNQFALYQELTKINATTRQISYEMSAIRGYTQKLTALTALNTYYTAVTADNTAALTFLTILG